LVLLTIQLFIYELIWTKTSKQLLEINYFWVYGWKIKRLIVTNNINKLFIVINIIKLIHDVIDECIKMNHEQERTLQRKRVL